LSDRLRSGVGWDTVELQSFNLVLGDAHGFGDVIYGRGALFERPHFGGEEPVVVPVSEVWQALSHPIAGIDPAPFGSLFQ
jgi:hypothetical protein